MLDTGSPPASGATVARPVSPSSSLSHHHLSRSSTPGISSFDGTPLHLLRSRLTPPIPSAPLPREMVRTSHRSPPAGREDCEDALNPLQPGANSTSGDLGQRQMLGPAGQDMEKGRPLPPSVVELARTLHQRNEQKQKSHRAQEQFHRMNIAIARTSRLVQNARSIQQTLAECIRCEDKQAFSSLFNAFQDAVTGCSMGSGPAMQMLYDRAVSNTQHAGSVLDAISPTSREAVMKLIVRSSADTDYLTDRLAALTHKELLAILPDRGAARATDSVFASGTRASARVSRPIGIVVDKQVDLLTTSSFGSPLETMVATGCSGAGIALSPDCNFSTIWATVCANLIKQEKPGSDRLVPALLDLWANSGPWLGKARLESWIVQVLKDGHFLLDQPHKQSFRVRVQGRHDGNSESEVQAEAFYFQAMESLLDLIADDQGPSILPSGALEMCHAIWCALQDSSRHQYGFPHFVATRWIFTSFLSNAILLPEAHGMFLRHYIPDVARHKILREIVLRCQKTFLDVSYSWKHGSFVSPDNILRVQAVLNRLQRPSNVKRPAAASNLSSDSSNPLVISSRDMMVLIDTLHPDQRSGPHTSDRDTVDSGRQSSNSSLSGMALFKTPRVDEAGVPSPSVVSSLYSDDNLSLGYSDNTETKAHDHQRLREAHTEIEDFYLSRRPDDPSQWALLVPDMAHQGLRTIQERVKQVKSQVQQLSRKQSAFKVTPNSVASQPAPAQSCDNAVEHVLLYLWDPGEVSILRGLPSAMTGSDPFSTLDRLFDEAVQDAEEKCDYVSSHAWFSRQKEFRTLFTGSKRRVDLQTALLRLQERARLSCARAESILTLCNDLEDAAGTVRRRFAFQLQAFQSIATDLRDKMWYTADVRTSAAYDEARSIASALRIMGKSKRSGSQNRLSPQLRSWSATRVSSPSPHIKSEAQILEVLSAAPNHGGPNKLSDEQAKATAIWMERHRVENFCRGEERLHKLCMAIRKCADILTNEQHAENPVLWASILFSGDKHTTIRGTTHNVALSNASLSLLDQNHRQVANLGNRIDASRSIDAISTASYALSGSSSREFQDTRSPALTSRSSGTLWSPAITDHAPSSATSVASYQSPPTMRAGSGGEQTNRHIVPEASLDKIRQSLVSLLVSDVAAGVFDDGSETDRAFWRGPGGELTTRYLRSERALTSPQVTDQEGNELSGSHFDFDGAFEKMLRQFAQSCDPAEKMDILLSMQNLIEPYMARRMKAPSPTDNSKSQATHPNGGMQHTAGSGISDINIEGFRVIFGNSSVTPTTIFRDLQYIASLTPAETLENSPQGKAFWNAGIALSGVKAEVRKIMVETADNIIAYHSNNRGHGRSASTQQQQRDSATFSTPARAPSVEEVAKYTMADAAHLLQIAAKEGDTTAQRELATLYLTHPELMDHIIAPFSRPKDVFKDELESKWRKNQDPNRCDPATMCVAHHWMSLSSKGGDALAKEYLRQRDEMEKLP